MEKGIKIEFEYDPTLPREITLDIQRVK